MDQRELRGLRTYALYCIVAAALLAVVFLFYFSRTKQNIQEQAEAQLTEVTRQYANAIKADMRGNIQTVEALAHVFGELGQGNPETIIPLITGAVATLGLKRQGSTNHPRRVAPLHRRPDLRRPGPPLFQEGAPGLLHRRHPARGQDRQHPHQRRALLIHPKSKIPSAPSSPRYRRTPSSCPSTTAFSTAAGRCSSPTIRGISCSGGAARSRSPATTTSRN